jgi:hypothetical protein
MRLKASEGTLFALCRKREVERMNRRVSLFTGIALAVGCLLMGATAQAQTFAGKWVHNGPKGVSSLEFYPGDRMPTGAVRGHFHHSIIMDDGRVIEGYGTYVLRFATNNRGRLVLHFSDGHVTREHEHTFGPNVLRLEHHGLIRDYIRQ